MARRMRGLVDGGFPYFVATRGYEILGYAYAGPYRPRPAYRFTLEDSVYVAAHAQGSALVAACSRPWSRRAKGAVSGR